MLSGVIAALDVLLLEHVACRLVFIEASPCSEVPTSCVHVLLFLNRVEVELRTKLAERDERITELKQQLPHPGRTSLGAGAAARTSPRAASKIGSRHSCEGALLKGASMWQLGSRSGTARAVIGVGNPQAHESGTIQGSGLSGILSQGLGAAEKEFLAQQIASLRLQLAQREARVNKLEQELAVATAAAAGPNDDGPDAAAGLPWQASRQRGSVRVLHSSSNGSTNAPHAAAAAGASRDGYTGDPTSSSGSGWQLVRSLSSHAGAAAQLDTLEAQWTSCEEAAAAAPQLAQHLAAATAALDAATATVRQLLQELLMARAVMGSRGGGGSTSQREARAMAAAGFQAEVGELDLQEGLMQLALEVTALQEQLVALEEKQGQQQQQAPQPGNEQQEQPGAQRDILQPASGPGSFRPEPVNRDLASSEQQETDKQANGAAGSGEAHQQLQDQVRLRKQEVLIPVTSYWQGLLMQLQGSDVYLCSAVCSLPRLSCR